jgi:hypothetical protein
MMVVMYGDKSSSTFASFFDPYWNPSGRITFTSPYEDPAGKGFIITGGYPFHVNGVYLGE